MPFTTSRFGSIPPLPRSFPPAFLVQGGLALGLLILAVLASPFTFFSISDDYPPIHIALEFLSISIALMIFTIGWFAFSHHRGARFQILACTFLAIALLDFSHTLSYQKVPDLITLSTLEKTSHFWLPAQFLSALALLTVAILPPQMKLTQPARRLVLAITLAVIILVIALELFLPATVLHTFIPDRGLVLFRTTIEYAVTALYTVALALFIQGWRQDRDRLRALLATGAGILLLGKFSQMIHPATGEFHNLIGHIHKVWGDGFIFWAVCEQAIDQPYRRLQRSEGLLARSVARADALLRENQVLLDNALIGIFFTKDRHFIRVNRHGEMLLGYAPGELDQQSTVVIYPDHAAYLALGARAYPIIERGESYADEIELVRKDGLRIWCLMRAQNLAPDQPQEGSVWLLEDVTELRQARQALEESAELYHAIFESRHVVKLLIQIDNGQIVDANQAAADFYGYPRKELRLKYAWDLSDQTQEELLSRLSLCVKNQDLTPNIDSRHRRRNGEWCNVAIYSDLIHRGQQTLLLVTVLDITEQHRIAVDHRKLSLVVEQNPASVVITDVEGHIEYVNPRFVELTGYSAAEVIGQNPRLLKSGETPAAEYDALWCTIHNGHTWRGTFHNRKKNGDFYWERAQISPLFDEIGRITHYVGIKENITSLKAAEDTVRESEARLQRVLSGSNDGFWDWNITTGEVQFSQRWAEMLGYNLAEITPHLSSWERLIHPDDQPQRQAALHAHLAGETPHYRYEHRMRTKDATWRWILVRGKVTARDTEGRPLLMAGTHHDVTIRHCAEDALRESEDRFHTLVDLLPYGVQETNLAGRITFANPALETLYGQPRGGMIGHFIWDFLADDAEHESLYDYLQFLVREQPPPAPYFTKNRRADGSLIDIQADWSYRRDTHGQVQGFIVVVTNITERKRMQEALREQAIHDPLTGLFNRRHLDEALPRELHRRQRSGEPLTVAMLDLDHFKRFNDTYSHEAGDAVLRAVGGLLRRSLRISDIACRYGGEELTLILLDAPLPAARTRLDTLREAIMQLQIAYKGSELPTVTVSIGATEAIGQETDATLILGRADAALYRAKAQGRNRIVADGEE